MLTTDLHLFTPKPGIEWKMANYRGFLGTGLFFAANPQAGVVLDYFAKTAGPVRVTVKDKAGNDIRQLTGRAEAGAVNRIAWDMRSDAPIRPAAGQTAAGGGGGRGGRGGGGGGGGGGRARRGGRRMPAPMPRPSQRPKPVAAVPVSPEPRIPKPPAAVEAAVVAAAAVSAAIAATLVDPGRVHRRADRGRQDRNQNRHRRGRSAPQRFPPTIAPNAARPSRSCSP